jgi:hypothetical protein
MIRKKQSISVIVLIAIGLQLATMPLLLRNYLHLSDFGCGLIVGAGIGLELSALLLIRRNRLSNHKKAYYIKNS